MIKATAILLLAVVIGLIWGSNVPDWSQVVILIIPALWVFMPNSLLAGGVIMLYSLAASRGLIQGIAVFFDTSLFVGFSLWFAASLLPGLVGLFCWVKNSTARVLMIPVFLAIWAVPPVGLFGGANPIVASGLLVPSLGWGGLTIAVLTSMLLAYGKPIRNAVIAIIPMLVIAGWQSGFVETPKEWKGISTGYHFGVGYAERDRIQEIRRHWNMQFDVSKSNKTYYLFPETVGGYWNSQITADWQRALKDQSNKTVLMGAYEQTDASINNALFEVNHSGSRVVYRQRMPAPVGMWTPWNNHGFNAYWFDNPVVTIAGKKTAVFICYEAIAPWLILHSMTKQPELMLFSASTWFAPRSVMKVHQQSIRAWSRLFNVPLVEAYNQ